MFTLNRWQVGILFIALFNLNAHLLASSIDQVAIYCVQDQGVNDSQLCQGSFYPTISFTTLGPLYQDCDLEAMDVSPTTGEIYAAAGDNTPRGSHLYLVFKEDGNLLDLGDIGGPNFLKGVEALSFHPQTNQLWGWAQGEGLFVIRTLPSLLSPPFILPVVDLNHPLCRAPSSSLKVPDISAELVLAAPNVKVGDLTWNQRGDIIYAIENVSPKDSEQDGAKLWASDGKSIVSICPNLTSLVKNQLGEEARIEGIESFPADLFPTLDATKEDLLLVSLNNVNTMLFLGVVITSQPLSAAAPCTLWEWVEKITTPFNDIEGIAYSY